MIKWVPVPHSGIKRNEEIDTHKKRQSTMANIIMTIYEIGLYGYNSKKT